MNSRTGMLQSVLIFGLFFELFFNFFSRQAKAYEWRSPEPQDFQQLSFKVTEALTILNKNSHYFSDTANQENFLVKIREIKTHYLHIPRPTSHPEDLYEAQHLLRFFNFRTTSLLGEALKQKQISKTKKEQFLFELQSLKTRNNTFFKSPQQTLPISGIKRSDWPLERWADDPEYSNYQFEGDEVLYRNLRIKAGDIILNHPTEKPVGIFTSISSDRSSFAHSAMVVFLKGHPSSHNKRLPVVIDIHSVGLRAVPLHVFLSDQVIHYAEIFRLKTRPMNFEANLAKHTLEALKQDFPYDLIGNRKNHSLSCAELISYMLELQGLDPITVRLFSTLNNSPSEYISPIELQSQVDKNIYANLQKYGKFEFHLLMPNDIALDPRFEVIGYIDNVLPMTQNLVNEVLINDFRTYTQTHKINPNRRPPDYDLNIFMIDHMRDSDSWFGDLILMFTGYRRSNFPVGAKGILVLVNHIDTVYGEAMTECLNPEGEARANNKYSCFKAAMKTYKGLIESNSFSIHDLLEKSLLAKTVPSELHEYHRLFTNWPR